MGEARWFAVLDDGTERPVPDDDDDDDAPGPVAAPPVVAAPPPPPSVSAAIDPYEALKLALEYGEKNADRMGRAYKDAFETAGKAWSGVLDPMVRALEALAGRVETLEEELSDRGPATVVMQPHALQSEEEREEENQLDGMAKEVLSQAVQAGMGVLAEAAMGGGGKS